MAVNRSYVQTIMEHETSDWGELLQEMRFPDFTHNIVLLEYRLRTGLFAQHVTFFLTSYFEKHLCVTLSEACNSLHIIYSCANEFY